MTMNARTRIDGGAEEIELGESGAALPVVQAGPAPKKRRGVRAGLMLALPLLLAAAGG